MRRLLAATVDRPRAYDSPTRRTSRCAERQRSRCLPRAARLRVQPKPTTEAIAAAPRSDLRAASVEKGRIAGVLAIAFAEGATWEFDVPKVHLKGAQQIAAALS